MSAKRKHRTTNEFLSYLKGELRSGDRHSFERDLERDPFQQEAMEGFEMLTPGETEEDLLSLHGRLQKRLQRKKRITWYSVAATVASILVVGTIFVNIYDFNPDAKEESAYQEESLLTEKEEPEKDVPAPSRSQVDTEKKEVSSENAGAVPEQDELRIQEEEQAPEKVQAAEVMAPEEVQVHDDAQALDYDGDMAAAPEPMEAEAAEPDAFIVVEAESSGRQKRSDKRKAQRAAPQVSQYKAVEMEEAMPQLMGRVSGVVVSAEDMDPLPGASLRVKGTDSGFVTDMEGKFSMPAGAEAQTTVVASYVGMVTDEYKLDSYQENRLVMQTDQSTLNEVVVVAYGIQKDAYPVGAVQKVQVAEKTDLSAYTGAEPAGGIPAYKMYMEKNIRFPAGDTLSKREVVVLIFTVNQNGSLSGIQILRSPGDKFAEEAIRLLEEGPHWNPARDENGTTDDEVRMRIVFKK